MAQELWTVNRGGYDARVVRLSPYDQLTHCKTPTFEDKGLAEDFRDWFNAEQARVGRPLPIAETYQGYLLAAA
jgi:hypothetical protein